MNRSLCISFDSIPIYSHSSAGLSEYIQSLLDSAVAEVGIGDELTEKLNEQLQEFLEDSTRDFVDSILHLIRQDATGSASSPPSATPVPSARDQHVAHAQEEEEVDYEESLYPVEVVHESQLSNAVDSNVDSIPSAAIKSSPPSDDIAVDDELMSSSESRRKRKRRDDDDDDDSSNRSKVDAAVPSSSKRPFTDRTRPRKPCFDFQRRGHCSRGDNCHFEHATSIQTQQSNRNHHQQQQQQQQHAPLLPHPHMTSAHPNVMPTGFEQSFMQAGAYPAGPFVPNPQVFQPHAPWMQQQHQQQMAMQMAMQQQYIMQQHQLSHAQHPASSNSVDTEITLTGPSSVRSSPPQVTVRPTGNGPSDSNTRVGIGFVQPRSHQFQPTSSSSSSAASTHSEPTQRFVRAQQPEMEATFKPQTSAGTEEEKSTKVDDDPSHPDDDYQDVDDTADGRKRHRPLTGAGASIPFSYPTPSLTRGRGGGRGGRGGGRFATGFGNNMNNDSPSNCRVFVSNIPSHECSLVALSPHFAQFGTINSIKIIGSDAAIVTFDTHSQAEASIQSDKAPFDNRSIRVDWAKQEGAANPHHRTNPKNFTSHSTHTKPPSVAPPQSAPLSAIEVAKAIMASKQSAANANAASSTNHGEPSNDNQSTALKESSSPAPAVIQSSSAAPSSTSSSSPSPLSSTSNGASSVLQSQLSSLVSHQKSLQSRLAVEKDTLTLADKKAIMTELVTLTKKVMETRKELANGGNGTTNASAHRPLQSSSTSSIESSAPASAPSKPAKLSALEVVAQMRAKQAAAAAAAAAATTADQ